MSSVISYARDGAVFDVRFNDAAGGNLISNDEGDNLVAELGKLAADVRLVRIRSNGPTFCVGRVSPMPPPGSKMSGQQLKTIVAEPALRVYEAIRMTPVPVLAIVEGAADGYGCAIVTACDLAVATDDATFRVPEVVSKAELEAYMTQLGAIKEFLRATPGLPFPSIAALAANLTGTALANRFIGESAKP